MISAWWLLLVVPALLVGAWAGESFALLGVKTLIAQGDLIRRDQQKGSV